MTRKVFHLIRILFLAAILAANLTGCVIFGGQRIYEDPEHVDFGDGEEKIEEPETTASEDKGGTVDTYFEQDGFWLFYDPQLVLDVQPFSETIPAATDDEPNMVAHPDIIHFDLSMEQAHVYIAETNAYDAAADFASESFRKLSMLISDPGKLSDCVPELPLNVFYRACDHQQFAANLKQVDFANGSGVRFITVHGIQDFVPVDNEHLVYVFQGFTDDGDLYVKMYVRLLHAQLPDSGEIPAEVYIDEQDVVEKYFSDIADKLNVSEDDFSPKLDWIDAFLLSLRIAQPG